MIDEAMEEFLGACGSGGPLVLGVEEPGASGVSWRVFEQPFVVVGRGPAADLRLDDPGVSRRHAYFQMIAGRLFCVDLQSRTGTRWGDEPGLWGWVNPDGGVRVGPYRIRPREAGVGPSRSRPRALALPAPAPRPSDQLPVSRSFEQPSLAEARLEILGTSDGPVTWQVSRALVLIGGSRACKVQLKGGGVADIHASLLRTPSGVFIVDLVGRGDVLVNRERVRHARLGEDDEVAVGTHRIRMSCGPARSTGSRPRTGGLAKPSRSPGPGPLAAKAREDVPALSDRVDDAESLLRSMIGEFGQVQAQTAAGFQETLAQVIRSFAEVQREQMAMIREELAHLRELSAEQQLLRSQVEPQGPGIPGRPTLRLVSGDPREPAPGPSRRDAPPAASSTIQDGRDGAAHASAAPSGGAGAPPRPIGIPDPAGLHTRIFDRLEEIQGERQGRWQRLMEALVGKSG